MGEQWRGLHNPGRHEPYFEMTGSADCMGGECGESCTSDRPCYCCLAAEVEVWKAKAQANKAALLEALTVGVGRECLLKEAQAQVQRVREEVNGDQPIPRASDDLDNVAAYCAGYVDALRRVRRALEGDA